MDRVREGRDHAAWSTVFWVMYREMPGLALTIEQARRLWGCDAVTCQRIVDVLVERHVLRWSRDGRLIRAE